MAVRLLGGPFAKVWKMCGSEDAAVFGHTALLADVAGVDADQRVLGEGGEGVVCLVGEVVAVGEEQDARAAGWLAGQVPAAVEQFPGDLKGDESLAGAGGEREQDALTLGPDGFQHAVDCDVLVVAAGVGAAFVLERHGGETIAPGVLLGVGLGPEFGGGRVAGQFALGPLVHVDAVDVPRAAGVAMVNEPQVSGKPFAWATPRVRGSAQALASTTASLVLR